MDRVSHLPQIIQLDEKLQQEVRVPKSHPTTLSAIFCCLMTWTKVVQAILMYLPCRSKEDNTCILKHLQLSGFLMSEINASDCKASWYYTDQVRVMDMRAFCFEAIVQSWASNLVSLVFSFLICKDKGCINILKSFWLWQFMKSMVCLKGSWEEWASYPWTLDWIFLQYIFPLTWKYALQTTVTSRHWMSCNRSTRQLCISSLLNI